MTEIGSFNQDHPLLKELQMGIFGFWQKEAGAKIVAMAMAPPTDLKNAT